jgi:hypothetical protein
MDYSITYEWRTFDEVSDEHKNMILALPVFQDEKVIDDYLFEYMNSVNTVKIGESGIKIKRFLYEKEGIIAYLNCRQNYPFGPNEVDRYMDTSFIRSFNGGPIPNEIMIYSKNDLINSLEAEGYSVYPNYPEFEGSNMLEVIEVEKNRNMRIYDNNGVKGGIEYAEINFLNQNYKTIGIKAKTYEDVSEMLDIFQLRQYTFNDYANLIQGYLRGPRTGIIRINTLGSLYADDDEMPRYS